MLCCICNLKCKLPTTNTNLSKSTRKGIFCDICSNWYHLKCTKVTENELIEFNVSQQPYYYPKCLNESLPFENLNDIEIMEEPNNAATKQINSFAFPSIDDELVAVNPNCCYRSVQWLSKNISTKNTLSVLHFNTRSIPKDKNLIEELISALNHNPDVIAVTETKLNMNNIDVSPMQNYAFVY